MSSLTNTQPDQSNEIRIAINDWVIMLLDAEGMIYKGQRVEDAGEARNAWLKTMAAVYDAWMQNFVPRDAVLEFAKWSEGIFREYASLKPDECDAPEVQDEVNASIAEDRKFLLRFLGGLGLLPEDEEDETWLYDAEFILEMLTYGMVEGGHMPAAHRFGSDNPPGREELIKGVRDTLARTLTVDHDTGKPEWVVNILREINSDEDFMLSLCHEVCGRGWVEGRSMFEGAPIGCWEPAPGAPTNLQRVEALRAKFVPPARPEETPEEGEVAP